MLFTNTFLQTESNALTLIAKKPIFLLNPSQVPLFYR